MLKVYIDAATKGNPGPSGGGLMITGENRYIQESFPLAILTNHQAEFAMLITALNYLKEHVFQEETIFIYTDSKVLAQTIEKNHTNNRDFQGYLAEFNRLADDFPLLLIQWLPEKENKGADHLARQGLQKALKANNHNK
ncbi:ribonuclease HI [Enterococcus sp. PF1-24]|uniref:ribonuclease HI family protein n=1 Tax=unclassified Enterococcus TaxID=2608891 RepID=UPI0024742272|nr:MULTISPECIES: ribonuclease HI family protein [unclassified Enterococcus]MDH6364051.1 ribonuclease HI [Enterococcus sp. PFB1-1]MDH6401152.1 ribonuclease HI [Enterococcus sp. PF1-24]